jgi:hypothetical protein
MGPALQQDGSRIVRAGKLACGCEQGEEKEEEEEEQVSSGGSTFLKTSHDV